MSKAKDKNIDPLLESESQPAPDKPTSTAPAEDKAVDPAPIEPDQPAIQAEKIPNDTPEPPITAKEEKKVSANEAKNKDIIAETKEILAKKPHTNFIIPLAEGEAVGSFETVQINGYKLTIQKGVMVNIPVPVANILAEKYKIAMTAGQDKKIDRAPDIQDALS